ncbi:glycosyltransferase [Candidatus Nomurabacteria bacterium]|nr:glycosyltransferase [Candidatus Nomurabacteria bacterium]
MKEKKIKILYAITKANWGGAQRYVFDLASSLPRDKYDIVVCFGKGESLTKKLREKYIRTVKIKSLDREISFINDLRAIIDLFFILIKERPDILHLNSSKMGGIGALVGRLVGIKRIIFTAHGWAFNEDRGLLFKKFVRLTHCFTIIASHITIAVSENIKNQVCDFPFLKRKIVVVKHGIKDIDFYEKMDSRKFLLPKTKVGLEFFWIGIIAELHKVKGLEFAIRAMAKLENTNSILIIIGSGDTRNDLLKLIGQLNLNRRVFLLGQVEDASKYLKAFDLFVLSSLSEALGYVILESGLASLPTIASRVGGIPEIIENGKSGILVEPKNPEAIADAISSLEEDLNKRIDLGLKLNEKVKKEFSFNRMINETWGIYEVGDLKKI